jgi:hypothetical protein
MSAKETKGDTLYCSFCKKSQHKVEKLIAGPKIHICDECVWLCMCIVAELPNDTPDELYDDVVAFMRKRCPSGAGGPENAG